MPESALRRIAALLVFVTAGAISLTAGGWPQWRGPGSQGVSAETDLPTTWSPTRHVL